MYEDIEDILSKDDDIDSEDSDYKRTRKRSSLLSNSVENRKGSYS